MIIRIEHDDGTPTEFIDGEEAYNFLVEIDRLDLLKEENDSE